VPSDLHVRDVDDDLIARLKRRAAPWPLDGS
jgi:hypothetical protein